MRYLSLCSGIEAATVAWHPMGWEPAAFAEIEAFPAAVLKHHYPNTPNLGDMTKWREWNVGAIDLLVGGTPCQSFSVAGLRKGLSDPRGGLMLTFLEIAQSLRPRWVVWENVPGVLSSGGGRDFGSFLGALGELGYGWAYRVLDAQWCRVDGYERAVPQRRRRVFVVGCLGDATRAAQVLFERQSVERNPATRRAKGQGAAADAEDGVETSGCYWDGSDCAATLTKQNANGGQRMPDKANFGAVLQPVVGSLCADDAKQIQQQMVNQQKFVVETRCFAGSSFARYDESQSASTIRREGGDLGGGSETFVAVPFRKSHRAASATDDESWVRAETANTLNRFDTGERDTHAIAFTPSNLSRGAGPSPNSEVAPTQKCSAGRGADDQRTCVAFTCKDHGADAGDVAPTLRAMPHDGSHANGGGQVAVAHGFYSTGGTHGVNMEPEVSPAVKVGSGLGIPSPPAVAFKPAHFTRGKDGSPADITPPLSADADKGDQDTVVVAPSLTASNDPSRSPQSAEVTQQVAAVHQATMVVRRLTPVECERLQGFPDDYTNIPWRGKPESPDGPRYKALGNSMAVNCMRWIGRRIDAVEKGTELPD